MNYGEWSREEKKEGRTCWMEWRYNYSSYYIDARSLQGHMEVGMVQFGVKVSKNQFQDEKTWVCKWKLEYASEYSSM